MISHPKPSHPKPPQIVYGKNDPMFSRMWHNHSVADRRPRRDPAHVPGRCQRCGRTGLRYVHLMESPDFSDRVEVGCECAQVLCPTYDPYEAEHRLRTRDRRLADWLSLSWWKSVVGNQYLNGSHYEAGVVAVPPGYRWWIRGLVSIWSEIIFDTSPSAFAALFDYLDTRDMRGEYRQQPHNFSLVAALQEIEDVCRRWSEPFRWLSDDYYLLDFSTILGRIGCKIYTNEHYAPFWELYLTLPDVELGSKKYPGPNQTCRTAIEAKVAALDIFRKEMTRLVYEHAGLDPEPSPPSPDDDTRKQIADAHCRADAEREARAVAERLAAEQRQKQREWESQLLEQLQNLATPAAPQPPPPKPAKAAKLNLQEYRQYLRTQLPSPRAALLLGVTVAVLGIRGLFHQVKDSGNYTAVAHIESAPMRCTVFRQSNETWKVGVFAPFNLIEPWSAQSFLTADEALEAAARIFRAKMMEWMQAVLKGMEQK